MDATGVMSLSLKLDRSTQVLLAVDQVAKL